MSNNIGLVLDRKNYSTYMYKCTSVLLNAWVTSHVWSRKACEWAVKSCRTTAFQSAEKAWLALFQLRLRVGHGKTFLGNTIIHELTGWVVCRGESSPASFSDSSLADTLGVESHDVLSVLTVYSHSDVAIYRQQHISSWIIR